MGEKTDISWTHHTFSPWEGCTKVSEGCRNCYAEALNHRWGKDNWGRGKTRLLRSEAYWRAPLKWNRAAQEAGERRRVFCASVADVFDAEAADEQRIRLWGLIRATPSLDWLLLTKRPQNIASMAPLQWVRGGFPENVWLGISVENQAAADERIPILCALPAKVRFLSCEPLLGPVDIEGTEAGAVLTWCQSCEETGVDWQGRQPCQACEGFGRIHWVIAGGESGHNHRPMQEDWVRSLRDQCLEAGVAFHFKQWGGRFPGGDAILDGQQHRAWPEVAA